MTKNKEKKSRALAIAKAAFFLNLQTINIMDYDNKV